jgi:O-antigen biosynthesis protein
VNARIDSLAWLANGLAILIGEGEIPSGSKTTLNGDPIEARSFRYIGRAAGHMNLITLLTSRRPSGEQLGRLSVDLGGSKIDFEPIELGDVTVDLQTLVRSALAPLPAHTRTEILEFLAATPVAHPLAAGASLNRNLLALREALRERLTPSVVDRDEAIGLAIECVLAIDEHCFFMQGWFRDAEAPVISLRAVSPEGASVELLHRIYRFERPDLERLYGVPTGDPGAGTGFACCFDLAAPSRATGGWILELRNSAGSAVEAPGPRVVTAKEEVRNLLLGDLGLERPSEDTLTHDHLHPAISRLQQQNSERLRVDRLVQFGEPPTDPEVSIVIPLYRRIDLIQHQLAQFSLDSEMAHIDLIYVLDSPEHSRDLIAFASALVDLYRVPFRVATLGQNVGFAGANWAGAALARGRLLLLMNSDVLPEKGGWLGAMVAFYDSKPRIGALGPKLLFEDDSIQHAGLFFRRPANSTFWENDHYFKGLHRDAPPANVSRVVPAVTGACMLVERDLFIELGGFSGSYVRGDYEDSEFCLRVIEAGRQNWYLADVALYHLEGQSYETSLRQNAARYNAWLHTHLWGTRIAQVMRELDPELPGNSSRPQVRIAEFLPKDVMNGGVADEVEAR